MSTNAEQIADLFDAWWKESFPFAPANKQTRENFIAFGKHLLDSSPGGGEADASN